VRSSLYLAGAAAIWGLAFVAQRISLGHVGAFTFNGLRFGLGALSLVPLTFFLKPSRLTRGQYGWRPVLWPGLAAGIILFVAAGLQQVGLKWTTVGKAAFLTGFYILLVPILGLFVKRRPHLGVWLGATVGLVGLYFLSVTEAFTVGLGDGIQLLGAVFWACHILVIGRFSPQVDPLKLSVVQFFVCSILSLAVGLPLEPFSWGGVGAVLGPLLYTGLLSVGVAYTFQTLGQSGIAPGPAALIMSLETVFAVLGGWVLLGETLGLRELIGCALMLAGMVMAQVWPVTGKLKASRES
jgi:drug/metabolite transporter (DMT)-like permease